MWHAEKLFSQEIDLSYNNHVKEWRCVGKIRQLMFKIALLRTEIDISSDSIGRFVAERSN